MGGDGTERQGISLDAIFADLKSEVQAFRVELKECTKGQSDIKLDMERTRGEFSRSIYALQTDISKTMTDLFLKLEAQKGQETAARTGISTKVNVIWAGVAGVGGMLLTLIGLFISNYLSRHP